MNTSRLSASKWLYISLAVVSVAVALLWLYTARKTERKTVSLPEEEEVETMTAKVHDLEEKMSLPPVPEFTIPREYVPVLLNAVKPAEQDNGGGDAWGKVYENVAEMKIQMKAGQTIRISFYDVGKTVAGFTVDGVRCFRGGEHKPIFICDEYQSYEDESVLMCGLPHEWWTPS
jgi:hypothetical protein